MTYAYVVTGSEDGILGVYSNGRAATKRAARYVGQDQSADFTMALWRRAAKDIKENRTVYVGGDEAGPTQTTAEIERYFLET